VEAFCPIYLRLLLNSLAGGPAALKFSAFVVRAGVYINFVIALAGFLVFSYKNFTVRSSKVC
jgi:hypothetical protein